MKAQNSTSLEFFPNVITNNICTLHTQKVENQLQYIHGNRPKEQPLPLLQCVPNFAIHCSVIILHYVELISARPNSVP